MVEYWTGRIQINKDPDIFFDHYSARKADEFGLCSDELKKQILGGRYDFHHEERNRCFVKIPKVGDIDTR